MPQVRWDEYQLAKPVLEGDSFARFLAAARGKEIGKGATPGARSRCNPSIFSRRDLAHLAQPKHCYLSLEECEQHTVPASRSRSEKGASAHVRLG